MKVAIIGAGITGVTTAYFLSEKKVDVTLIEGRRYPAMATSYANGGQLSASNSEAWNSWHNVKTGLKSMINREHSSLIINPFPTITKLSWLCKFIYNIKNNEKITHEICRMAIKSISLYEHIAKKEALEFDKLDKGIIHLYANKKHTQNAEYVNNIYRKAGLNRFRITHEELYKIEPSLKNKKLDSIFYTPSDKTGDIHKFCIGLTNKLIKNKKIKILSCNVDDIKEYTDNFDFVIVCAGVYSPYLAKSIGEKLPIYPVKGYSITINNPGRNAPTVSLLDDFNKIVTSRLGRNRLRVAGFAEFNGYNLDIIQNRVRPLIKWCMDMFPEINTKDIKPWAGLRPMTPNMLPIVRQSKANAKVWYNTGHGHLGWTLSAYTGKLLTEKILLN
ncbi:MAG: D-amino acid dehydrogenase [Alphaproteobacteria bacterium MarineAlpha9_Bin4]|nr:MAG: D-amino acid dehydrogenase [Alphaproteobacteria bacterium MarineAlpha9_Bin4]